MKKQHLIRLLSALLLCLLLSSAVACGNATGEIQTTAPVSAKPEATEDVNDPKIPAIDWNGEQFNILYNGSDLEPNLDFVAEETNGNTLNDAVYKRNLSIQEKYGLTIVSEKKSDSGILSAIETATASGDMVYHLTEANQCYSMSMGLRGAVVFVPLCGALFLKGRIAPGYAIASVLAGPSLVLAGKLLFKGLPFDPLFLGILANIVIMAFGIRRRKS